MASVDYAALYPVPDAHDVDQALADIHEYEWDHCEACSAYADMLVTPRNAAVLAASARFLHEVLRAEIAEGVYDTLEGFLPRYARREGGEFFSRFADVFAVLADRIDAGDGARPRSTAEELALAAVIEECQGSDPGWCVPDELPVHPSDFDFALLDELLFDDHDIRFTFDFERASGDLAYWFEPFGAVPVLAG